LTKVPSLWMMAGWPPLPISTAGAYLATVTLVVADMA